MSIAFWLVLRQDRSRLGSRYYGGESVDENRGSSDVPANRLTLEHAGRIMLGVFEIADVIREALHAVIESSKPLLTTIAGIDWVEVKRRVDQLPAQSKHAMAQALAKGWFFGWHDSLQSLVELLDRLAAAPSTELDALMVEYYRANMPNFAQQLSERYPDRALAIKAAVTAHTSMPEGGFLLSIPVFIAQTDGLLAELVGVESPMTRQHGANVIRERYANDQETLDLLLPLLELGSSTLLMSSKERKEFSRKLGAFDALNRHQVMHGERSDYGSEMNSLRAFSLLAFVGLHMPAVTQKKI